MANLTDRQIEVIRSGDVSRIHAEIERLEAEITLREDRMYSESDLKAAVEQGRQDMFRWIRGSLEGYPGHGGDINIMVEVERIARIKENAAYRRGVADGAKENK